MELTIDTGFALSFSLESNNSIWEIYNPLLHPDGPWYSLQMHQPKDMGARDPGQIWERKTRALSTAGLGHAQLDDSPS